MDYRPRIVDAELARLIADAIPNDTRASRPTIFDYRDALSQLWLLDQVPAFTTGPGRLHELGQASKHQLADPALAAHALNVTADSLISGTAGSDRSALRDGPLLGALFESLVTLSLRVYAQPLGLEVGHLRTHRGEHEVDLVLHSPEGRVLAVEVKLAESVGDQDVRHLNWLADKLGEDVVDRLIITTGRYAYRRPDGVAVVPLALLGP